MLPRHLTNSLVFYLCLLAFFGLLTSCQYQPSSLARTEVPLFIPPTHPLPTLEPTITLPHIVIIPTETKPASIPTIETAETLECQFSSDPDYGFSADNPIQVGSNRLSDGPERELIYLLTLRGPKGEEVFYTRQSPEFNQAGTIVDPYLVEYGGIKEALTLYFDLYTYAPLLVPLGFTCEAPFPIQPPQE